MSKGSRLETVNQISANIEQLNQQIIPKTKQIHNHIRTFHNQEISQFQSLIRYVENVNEEMHYKQGQCQTYLHQISQKRKEREKLGQMSVGVLEAKSDQIKSKVKNIDAVSSYIKQTVAKVKPEKLMKLPVTGDQILKQMFTTIYQVIYADDKSKFDWHTFKKLALKHENGQDFIFRLVNVNFKDLGKENNDSLLKLKNNPAFQHITVNSKYSEDIIDLADWVEYVCLGYQFSEEKRKAQKQYERIRKDMGKKSANSLQMSQKFWQEQKQEIQKYIVDLEGVASELKVINYNLQQSVKDSDALDNNLNAKIENIRTQISEISSQN